MAKAATKADLAEIEVIDEPMEMEAGFEDAMEVVKENESKGRQQKPGKQKWEGQLPIFNGGQDAVKTGEKSFVVLGRGVKGVASLSPVQIDNVCDESEAIRIYFWTLRRITTKYSPYVCPTADWKAGKRP